MSLRAFLQSQGLTEKDIDDAVNDSREAVRMVQTASGMASKGLEVLLMRVKNEKLAKVLLTGYALTGKLNEGCAELLKKR